MKNYQTITSGNSPVEVIRLYGIFDTTRQKHQAGSVYDVRGICPTLDTMQGGYRQPLVEVKKYAPKD